jgi:hypothetical protein
MDSRWKNIFFYLSFLGNIFFQENFEIQDGHQRSHDHPIEKNSKQVFFLT